MECSTQQINLTDHYCCSDFHFYRLPTFVVLYHTKLNLVKYLWFCVWLIMLVDVLPNFQNSFFTFWCWPWKSSIKIADRIHSSLVFSPSFLLASSLISWRITCFCFDDSLTLSLSPSKKWVHLTQHTPVNRCCPKWSMPKVCCVHNFQIITCLMWFFCQPLHKTRTLYPFVIAKIRWLIINLLLLPCEFSCRMYRLNLCRGYLLAVDTDL